MPWSIYKGGVRSINPPSGLRYEYGESASFATTEPSPSLILARGPVGAFAATEPLPAHDLRSRAGSFALRERAPVTAFGGYGPLDADFATTENPPVTAFSGNAATTFATTEPQPITAFASSSRQATLTGTEPIPTAAFTVVEGDTDAGASFATVETAPILRFIAYEVSEAGENIVTETEGARPLDDYDAFSVNVANRAHSGFTNYQFNSFFTFNGKDYGVSDDGVFELTGDDDDGSAIPVKAIWGTTDLGTHYPKRFYRAFLTARDRGGYITVAAIMDEEERQTFPVDPSGRAGVHVIPIRLRRDMIGTEVAVEIANENGGDIDIPGLEIQHQGLKRRA